MSRHVYIYILKALRKKKKHKKKAQKKGGFGQDGDGVASHPDGP
jgi:hypothetical protein